MKPILLAAVASLLAGAAFAQTTPSTTTAPSTTAPATPMRPSTAMGAGTMGSTAAPTVGTTTGTSTTATGAATTTRPSVTSTTAGSSTDHNPAIATNAANAAQPAHGSNSFTAGEAQGRITRQGFANVTGLKKDTDGVWRGQAQKGGQQVSVWLDYKGNVGTN